ncbi:acyl-CoA synthetase [Candidatus Puniceispirillum sp.]|nr:acyl-CoA synthetase [Candidatus Puniceispirillum sp.]
MTNPYDIGLDQNPANYQPLTPLTFLERAAMVFPNQTAVIHGSLRRNYAALYARCRQLASVLTSAGLGRGDTVSVMLLNTPAMIEAHYGVPMSGAVLHSLNTRLDAATIAFQLDHAETKILIVDISLLLRVREALTLAKDNPQLIIYDDAEFDGPRSGYDETEYETFIASGDADFAWKMPDDEWDAITINYTSGTTGDPKGVVYHHRGAYLLAQGNALTASMKKQAIYLWTLPMFHCNGWCFPWTISAISGTHVCLREVRADDIWNAILEHRVSHMCGAPIVMSLVVAGKPVNAKLDYEVEFFTAAAPPPEAVLAAMKDAGFNVTHLYGLTETYGPSVVNDWDPEWDLLDNVKQAALKARQGVRYLALEGLDVVDPDSMVPVPRDGATIGEVVMRGNVVMKGYFKNAPSTECAFAGGWFHSGDLGVVHPDGYVQLKDRSKDIIISGGENISSIEVEDVLHKHSAVANVAVVAMPHEKWGETPCAFIEIIDGKNVSEDELRDWCRQNLAGFKVPSEFRFESIPKTSTGKIQKYALRQRIAAGGDSE